MAIIINVTKALVIIQCQHKQLFKLPPLSSGMHCLTTSISALSTALSIDSLWNQLKTCLSHKSFCC